MQQPTASPQTLPEKVWERHLVHSAPGEPDLLYIDLHLVHEVTSPQAFDGLRLSGRTVRRPDLTIATEDHNVPTEHIDQPIADPISAHQVETLRENTAEFGITNFPMGDPDQGIVHVIGPEQGRTLPGMTIVCGDSHTATHGAFGALAFGIGTSEVEHVLATQTLPQTRPKWMSRHRRRASCRRASPPRTSSSRSSARSAPAAASATSSSTAARRSAALSMEGRMTVCNMSIEAGAKAGLIAPDDTTFDVPARAATTLRRAPTGTPPSPTGARCAPTTGAVWDKEVVHRRRRRSRPQVTWGTNPGQVAVDRRRRPVARRLRRPDDPRDRRPGARVHGPRPPARRSATSPSTPCSSAVVHQQPHRGPPRRRRRAWRAARSRCRG